MAGRSMSEQMLGQGSNEMHPRNTTVRDKPMAPRVRSPFSPSNQSPLIDDHLPASIENINGKPPPASLTTIPPELRLRIFELAIASCTAPASYRKHDPPSFKFLPQEYGELQCVSTSHHGHQRDGQHHGIRPGDCLTGATFLPVQFADSTSTTPLEQHMCSLLSMRTLTSSPRVKISEASRLWAHNIFYENRSSRPWSARHSSAYETAKALLDVFPYAMSQLLGPSSARNSLLRDAHLDVLYLSPGIGMWTRWLSLPAVASGRFSTVHMTVRVCAPPGPDEHNPDCEPLHEQMAKARFAKKRTDREALALEMKYSLFPFLVMALRDLGPVPLWGMLSQRFEGDDDGDDGDDDDDDDDDDDEKRKQRYKATTSGSVCNNAAEGRVTIRRLVVDVVSQEDEYEDEPDGDIAKWPQTVCPECKSLFQWRPRATKPKPDLGQHKQLTTADGDTDLDARAVLEKELEQLREEAALKKANRTALVDKVAKEFYEGLSRFDKDENHHSVRIKLKQLVGMVDIRAGGKIRRINMSECFLGDKGDSGLGEREPGRDPMADIKLLHARCVALGSALQGVEQEEALSSW
ncbi:hypothetical protein B0T17DRAFT_507481 [Bombardia bombarda]|uniref:Uncharacterized protein n=1 Tax=Bombardia bombarda TaxID=252184 RepID=A0AA39XBV8_9PEZI|nr:hypothetical protein B0T17DRAFT_507481 [Bombardia bombarda]